MRRTPQRNALAVAAWLCAAAACPAADPPGKVPDVRTLEELRTLSAAVVLGDWDIRLALADAGDDAGPWRLLYCHTKYIGRPGGARWMPVPHRLRADARVLGPVSYFLDRVEPRALSTALVIHKAARPARGERDTERLYAAAILTTSKGTLRLVVCGPDGKAIQQRKLTVAADRRCPWRVFALRLPPADRAPDGPACVVEAQPRPAVPIYPKAAPVWRLEDNTRFKALHPLKRKVGFLPGRLPPWPQYEPRYYGGKLLAIRIGHYPYPLKLSLAADRFVLRSELPMIDQPARLLLARWWLNGKAVTLAPKGRRQEEDLAERIRTTRRMEVGFGAIPADLGPLRPGAKLTLQVMYCRDGFDPIPRDFAVRMATVFSARYDCQPMLSNRLTFPVPKRFCGDELKPAKPAAPPAR